MTDVSKMSKKAKKAYFAKFRGDWNGVKPVTKVVPDKRKKVKGGVMDQSLTAFFDRHFHALKR